MDDYEFENLDSILDRLALEAIDIPVQRGLEAHFPDAVSPKGETKHSLPADEEGQNAQRFISTRPTCFKLVFRHADIFSLLS
jgi:hypothetical protein